MIQLLLAETHEAQAILNFLVQKRGLKSEVLVKYKVGAALRRFASRSSSNQREELEPCIVFPSLDRNGDLIRLKLRSILHKSNQTFEPKGGMRALFGMHTVPKDCKSIVVTEGELDAMAVYQATGRPTVSLPNGANALSSEIVEALEEFESIVLWLDDDISGQNAAKRFAKKLGLQRCVNVQTRGGRYDGPKDANEALLLKKDLNVLLNSATRIPHEQIITFKDLREEVFRELVNPKQVEGLPSSCFPGITRLLKGHRPGELTLFTGRTGVGKTTFLSQLSLDYACQGVQTLWGSFEISNVRLAKVLLLQMFTFRTGKSAVEIVPDFEEWAELFEQLPIYFLKFTGSVPIDRVIDAMEYANYVFDVSHVVLDNLQFMTGGQGRGMDRFEVMDSALQKIREFASGSGSHVTLVIHPRKESERDELTIGSVFGSAKATQEADNVIVLQTHHDDPPDIRRLCVLKNRFDGQLGSVPLVFDVHRKIYLDSSSRNEPPQH
eukprot:CAMPEP_0182450230 /NCGR_PEP_ID=MMETSP1172-20130603/39874_1 /TAXON_ID=708627 /ORGANISM="Timspurckia oligopyrenoides, Strain CCMP3278" /LENGTH=494 /DNA_ID=CAMNT_0024647767 /DNA_START=513 /DNA_END=1997 /DNA_ORIENTATION=-